MSDDSESMLHADAAAHAPTGGPPPKHDRADAGLPPGDEPLDEEDDGTPAELADPFAGDENAKPVEVAVDEDDAPVGERHWYILKVQSNREDSIREALLRRISMQGMDRWFGEVVVPKEQVTEFKSGKKTRGFTQALSWLHPREHDLERRNLVPRAGDGRHR